MLEHHLQVSPYEIYQAEKCEALSTTVLNHSENSEQSNEELTVCDNQYLEQRGKVILSLSLSLRSILLDSQIQELEVYAVNAQWEILEIQVDNAEITWLFKLCENQ